MEDFEIEKNVVRPASRTNKYPFGDMDIGDSFRMPIEQKHHVQTASYHYGRYHNKKFSVREFDGDCRCWRIA